MHGPDEPVRAVAEADALRCVRCGKPVDHTAKQDFYESGRREPDDGRHCAVCREELETPPPLTLRRVLKESFTEGLFRRRHE